MTASSTSRKPVSRSFKLRISLSDSDSLSLSGIFDLQSDLCHRKFVYGECATSQGESLHRLNCLTGLCALYSRLTRKPSPATKVDQEARAYIASRVPIGRDLAAHLLVSMGA